MPRRPRRHRGRSALLTRDFEITSFRTSMFIAAMERRGEEPEIESRAWLELGGSLSEPLNRVSDIVISMYPEEKLIVGTRRPAGIGAILAVKPELLVVLSWTHLDFDRVLSIALAGQLKFGYVAFTEPHYNKASVLSASFSNVREE